MTSETLSSRALRPVDHAGRLTFVAVCDLLDVDADDGLSDDEARRRQQALGRNALPEPATVPVAARVARQLGDPMAIVEEVRAASALRALRDLELPHARVRRTGVVRRVAASELVPGGRGGAGGGDRVPADLRLGAADGVRVDESMLTGESIAVTKDPTRLAEVDASLGERPGEVFSGTLLTGGTAVGVVTATGPRTVLGGIAQQIAVAPRPTPLQTDLAHVTRQLGTVSVVVASGVLVLTLARTGVDAEGVEQAFLAAVALAVAAVPEGLATVTTVGHHRRVGAGSAAHG